MKISRSRFCRTLLAALVLGCLLASAVPAYAALSDPIQGTSSTNPNSGDAAWRQGWGNSLQPEFTLTGIPSEPGTSTPTLGFLYSITRDFPSAVPTDAPEVSWDPAGMMLSHTFDLAALNAPLSAKDLEGWWFVNLRFFNFSTVSTMTRSLDFGIDVTPPNPVDGFTSGVSLPTESRRRTVSWTNAEYDALSRDAFYHVFLNGQNFLSMPATAPVWMPRPRVTLEDLPPGVNTIGIRVEDRATNLSAMRTVTAIVDPGWPELSVTYPAQGAWVGGTKEFTAVSTDDAGAPTVTFKIDNVVWFVDISPPYTYNLNSKLLAAGHHTLTVTTRDLFGHTRSITRDFYVDNVAPTITSVSDSPDPWYPCLQDGYKDVAYFKAYINERCSDVFAQLYDEDGTTLISDVHLQNVGPGWVTVKCIGYDKSGTLINLGPSGNSKTYKYRFTARDRAGNWRNGAFNTSEVRNYEVVPVAPGTVKVIPR